MYSDDPLVLEIISQLKAHHVLHVVVSPGSRHYPIVRSLEHDSSFTLYSVVDERSAGFFALGLIQSLDAPVAVICTSGTASINFGSSVVEAFFQKLPLLALTPDRLPELLGQMEDQMFPQTNMFRDFTRYVGQLKTVVNDFDRWYVNRVLNEGLLALTANGGGPVQINIPIASPAQHRFTTRSLPSSRRVQRHDLTGSDPDWAEIARRLSGKRVMVVWGQSRPAAQALLDAFTEFTSSYDVLTLADHLSNLDHPSRVRNTMGYLSDPRSKSGALRPEIVLTLGGNLVFQDNANRLLRAGGVEHWRISEDGEIVDPFHCLTDVFAMTPATFFAMAASTSTEGPGSGSYAAEAHRVAAALPAPDDVYGETSAIGRFLALLPHGSVLHVANSAPIRMVQLYDVDPSIDVIANRGINGIDGCMSTAIGYAVASDRPNFLVVGDLAFFYDMNSLWVRHRPDNLRIVVMNNDGGAVMHGSWGSSPQVGEHVSAAHHTSVRGWVESVGLRYWSAASFAELDSALEEFVSGSAGVLEVFTEKTSDIKQLKSYHASLAGESPSRLATLLRDPVKAVLRRLGLLKFAKRLLSR